MSKNEEDDWSSSTYTTSEEEPLSDVEQEELPPTRLEMHNQQFSHLQAPTAPAVEEDDDDDGWTSTTQETSEEEPLTEPETDIEPETQIDIESNDAALLGDGTLITDPYRQAKESKNVCPVSLCCNSAASSVFCVSYGDPVFGPIDAAQRCAGVCLAAQRCATCNAPMNSSSLVTQNVSLRVTGEVQDVYCGRHMCDRHTRRFWALGHQDSLLTEIPLDVLGVIASFLDNNVSHVMRLTDITDIVDTDIVDNAGTTNRQNTDTNALATWLSGYERVLTEMQVTQSVDRPENDLAAAAALRSHQLFSRFAARRSNAEIVSPMLLDEAVFQEHDCTLYAKNNLTDPRLKVFDRCMRQHDRQRNEGLPDLLLVMRRHNMPADWVSADYAVDAREQLLFYRKLREFSPFFQHRQLRLPCPEEESGYQVHHCAFYESELNAIFDNDFSRCPGNNAWSAANNDDPLLVNNLAMQWCPKDVQKLLRSLLCRRIVRFVGAFGGRRVYHWASEVSFPSFELQRAMSRDARLTDLARACQLSKKSLQFVQSPCADVVTRRQQERQQLLQQQERSVEPTFLLVTSSPRWRNAFVRKEAHESNKLLGRSDYARGVKLDPEARSASFLPMYEVSWADVKGPIQITAISKKDGRTKTFGLPGDAPNYGSNKRTDRTLYAAFYAYRALLSNNIRPSLLTIEELATLARFCHEHKELSGWQQTQQQYSGRAGSSPVLQEQSLDGLLSVVLRQCLLRPILKCMSRCNDSVAGRRAFAISLDTLHVVVESLSPLYLEYTNNNNGCCNKADDKAEEMHVIRALLVSFLEKYVIEESSMCEVSDEVWQAVVQAVMPQEHVLLDLTNSVYTDETLHLALLAGTLRHHSDKGQVRRMTAHDVFHSLRSGTSLHGLLRISDNQQRERWLAMTRHTLLRHMSLHLMHSHILTLVADNDFALLLSFMT
ncbi:MAG: hypothetical protein MHM6MM_000582 [Cercozoa sp. M6MM]